MNWLPVSLESSWPLRPNNFLIARTLETLCDAGYLAYNFGAYGKAVLSVIDPALRHHLLRSVPLHRFTERTIVDVARFRAALERARIDGYALSDEEGMAGTRAVAAPVWNYEQRVIGALGVSFPLAARDRAAVLALGPAVRAAADRLSVHLGAVRPAGGAVRGAPRSLLAAPSPRKGAQRSAWRRKLRS